MEVPTSEIDVAGRFKIPKGKGRLPSAWTSKNTYQEALTSKHPCGVHHRYVRRMAREYSLLLVVSVCLVRVAPHSSRLDLFPSS